ncbi:MAG: crossover junction endodeoxyribonuclease RuvC [Alphaproteobacteria bacterium]|nr:crossover junction endodeoxyribonuclease RuvC [Rickettsiales bacterium]
MEKLILGIDPSLNSTGWAVLSCKVNSFSMVDCGTVSKHRSDSDYIVKILHIGQFLRDIINKYQIKEIAMEKTICNINPSSSLKLGMVRGAIMFVGSDCGATIAEYEPKTIKKALVGNGNASKEQVAFMSKQILGSSFVNIASSKKGKIIDQYDITDAIATCITHYNTTSSMLGNY